MNRGIFAVFGIAVFFAILFGSLTFETVMATPAEKQDVCHVDPDNDGAGLETISVKNNKSVEKHLAHGDHLEECFVCGDGFADPPVEACDDAGESATCNLDCSAASCGDGITNASAGEACDDSGESATCNLDCSAASCGDGITNASAGEACDDFGESATCNLDCSAASCGDGITNASAGETCDDSNTTPGDGCSDLCVIEVCGDGTVNNSGSEACDDGNTATGDGCSAICEVEPASNGICLCDDGTGFEVCHDTLNECNNSLNDCFSFCGFQGLLLSCSPATNACVG